MLLNSSEKPYRLLLTLLFVLASGACATLGGDPASRYSHEQLRDMGEKFLASGAHGQALKYLTLAEAKRSNDPVTQYDLGRAYDERGLPDQALAHYQKAVTLKPDYSEAYNALGAFYAKQYRYDLAAESFKKSLENPFYETPSIPLFNLGLIYESKDDLEGALKQYQEAVRLQPNYGLAYFRMGLVLEALRRADEARQAYSIAIRYSPDLAEAHYKYGAMSYTAGELENALYSLTRVIRLAPNTTMAYESKRYLDRLKGLMSRPTAKAPADLNPERLAGIEVMKDRDLLAQRQGGAVVPSPKRTEAHRTSAQEHKDATPDPMAGHQDVVPAPVQESESGSPAPSQEGQSKASTPSQEGESKAAMLSQEQQQEQHAEATPAPVPEHEDAGAAPAQDKNNPAITPTKSSKPDPRSSYIIQIGSFLDKANANTLENRLKKKGYEALTKALSHQVLGTIYAVQLRPMDDSEKAGELMKRLEYEEHVQPVLIKVPDHP